MGNVCLRKIPRNLNPRNMSKFVPPIHRGRVVKVYDGDTITIGSYLPHHNSELFKFSVRLRGIDCPELKTKDKDEKYIAEQARDFIKDIVLDEMVTLKEVDTEKYGRILADVLYKNQSLKDLLLEKRYAVPYDGGTKVCPKNWKRFHFTGDLD